MHAPHAGPGARAQDATISLYRCGPMVDLCTGPHLPNTGYLKAAAVHSMSRAFWRADVKREPLQVRGALRGDRAHTRKCPEGAQNPAGRARGQHAWGLPSQRRCRSRGACCDTCTCVQCAAADWCGC